MFFLLREHKQVPEDSEEANAFLKEQQEANNASKTCDEKNDKLNPIISTPPETSNSPSTLITNSPSQKVKSPIIPKSNGGKFSKSKVSLDQLASSLKKKPTKLNTLEKSKLDWKKYIEQEQIADELKYHNKNG